MIAVCFIVGAAVLTWVVSGAFAPFHMRITGRQVDQRPLEQAIARAARARPTEVVDLADFVPERWDDVRVFGGYSTGAAVSQRLGRDWGEGHETDEIAHEYEQALVFLRGGRVVAWIGHFSAASLACFERSDDRLHGRLRFYVREWILSDGLPFRLLVPARAGGLRSRAAQDCLAGNGP